MQIHSFPCEKCICSWQQVTSLKLHTAHLNTHAHTRTQNRMHHAWDYVCCMCMLLNWSLLWQKPQINVAIDFRNHCTKSTKVAQQLLDKHTVSCTHTHTCVRRCGSWIYRMLQIQQMWQMQQISHFWADKNRFLSLLIPSNHQVVALSLINFLPIQIGISGDKFDCKICYKRVNMFINK